MVKLHTFYCMIMTFALSIFTAHIFSGESIKDIELRREILNSKSDRYITCLHIATPLSLISPLIATRGFTLYNVGRQLDKNKWMIMGPHLKKQGLRNIALGSAAILPFAAFYYDLSKDMQEAKRARELQSLPKGPSLLALEEKNRTFPTKE